MGRLHDRRSLEIHYRVRTYNYKFNIPSRLHVHSRILTPRIGNPILIFPSPAQLFLKKPLNSPAAW